MDIVRMKAYALHCATVLAVLYVGSLIVFLMMPTFLLNIYLSCMLGAAFTALVSVLVACELS